ncbi:hypothetical protein ACSBL2_00375 [Pedobacter sp. AW31-3R]|uniref:hypothetical protein n=1 Tax=Pedobacter sp. AW31-3R TaxID=3445781 RepID=UPI003FA0F991
MAEIKLNLRHPTADKETPINVIVRYNNQKLVYSSGKKIHTKHGETADLKKILDIRFARVEGTTRMNFSELVKWFTYEYFHPRSRS